MVNDVYIGISVVFLSLLNTGIIILLLISYFRENKRMKSLLEAIISGMSSIENKLSVKIQEESENIIKSCKGYMGALYRDGYLKTSSELKAAFTSEINKITTSNENYLAGFKGIFETVLISIKAQNEKLNVNIEEQNNSLSSEINRINTNNEKNLIDYKRLFDTVLKDIITEHEKLNVNIEEQKRYVKSEINGISVKHERYVEELKSLFDIALKNIESEQKKILKAITDPLDSG